MIRLAQKKKCEEKTYININKLVKRVKQSLFLKLMKLIILTQVIKLNNIIVLQKKEKKKRK
jgi:hypothetical protein